MEQTPIEKAINIMKAFDMVFAVHKLEELLPYEKTYHRNIAEKAIDLASENYDERRLGVERADKNKYLNKNNPL